jgi:hypothetical protein
VREHLDAADLSWLEPALTDRPSVLDVDRLAAHLPVPALRFTGRCLMASMRKLSRRLAAWRRYAQRTPVGPWELRRVTGGHWRAFVAVQRERSRRRLPNDWDSGPARPWPGLDPLRQFAVYEPDGLDDDRPRCNVENLGEVCYCTRRPVCPFADDEDNEPHGPDDEDDAYDDEGYPWPGVVTEHAFSERGLL